MEQRKMIPIGIDLGTAYTRAAVFNGKSWDMIPDGYNNLAMPSYVAFTDSGVLVGHAARMQAALNPANTIFDVIRLIGRLYSDPSVQNDMRLWPFKVIADPNGRLQVEVLCKGKLWQFTPVEICSMILTHIKKNAETTLGAPIRDAVVTVPVYFNYQQRQAIKEAGMVAGLNFTQIINSPAATALFHGIERMSKSTNKIASINRIANNISRSLKGGSEEYNMIIFDMGAGTLDIAVVTIKDDVCKVRAMAGDIHLGGADFDNNLVDYYVGSLKQRGWEDISCIPVAISNLRTLCEKEKMSLFSGNIMEPLQMANLYNDVKFEPSITEEKFYELNHKLLSKCIHIMETYLRDTGLSIDALHEVILSGSSTRIPKIQYYIQRFFEGKLLNISPNMETATAKGAAGQAFYLNERHNWRGHCLSLFDATPFSIGVWSPLHETILECVPKNTNVPFSREGTIQYHRLQSHVEIYESVGNQTLENNLIGKFELPGDLEVYPDWRDIKVSFKMGENGNLSVLAEGLSRGSRKCTIINNRNPVHSQIKVREALLYREGEQNTVNTSTMKSLTRVGTSSNCELVRRKERLDKILSMDKEMSQKIMEQPSRQYVEPDEYAIGVDMSQKIMADSSRQYVEPDEYAIGIKMSQKITGRSSRQYVEPDEYAIGIDFGTTYTSVAVWQRNGVKIIENEYDSRYTCSVVAFTDTRRLIGDTVHKDQVGNPTNTIPNIKRLIGISYSDLPVHNYSNFVPFRVIPGKKNRSMVLINYKNEEKAFAPEEIAAMILSKMKEIAEAHLNSKVSKAVISVPASFNDSQRKAIKDAGAIAGLDVLQLLNETTAAAVGYFFQKVGMQNISAKTLLVFGLGGGNLEVSIVKFKEATIRVQAVAGEATLGGEDFDNNMVSYFVKKIMEENNKDIGNKPRSMRRLRTACEKAKRVLSTNSQTVVEVDALDEGIDFCKVITRKEFEDINNVLFNKSISCVERCLEGARLEKSSINEVVLVGGSTRIPKIQQLLQEFFKKDQVICKSINADEAVVHGAAVQAAILSGNEGINKFKMLELQDVTCSSFAAENKVGSTMNLLFPKHTPLPARNELIYSTCSDNLSSFLIEVQECELASTTVFSVSGITPKPRGKSIINLSFEVDSSGILNLTAKDASIRSEKNEVVISKENNGLTEEDIEKMKEAAASYKAEDEDHKARASALNSLENLAYRIKELAEGSNVSASDKINMKKDADDTLTWLYTDLMDTDQNVTFHDINDRISKLESLKSKVMSAGS